jgi:hypothetical protein
MYNSVIKNVNSVTDVERLMSLGYLTPSAGAGIAILPFDWEHLIFGSFK